MLWLNFAPILSAIQQKFAVTEGTASLLILVFPFIYVFLSMHAGSLIDRKGYRLCVGAASVMMAVFSCLRIFDQSFWVLLVAQVGIAIAQPYVVNGISKLVMDWFPESEAAIATGLGTMGMFLGMAAGLVLTPLWLNQFGFQITMALFAGISVAVAVAFLVFCKTKSEIVEVTPVPMWSEVRALFRSKSLVLLFVLAFIGLGFFNGLTTWLELILAPNGIDSVQAGAIGGALIVGGIIGAVVVPAISDRVKMRKPFLIGSVLAASVILLPFVHTHHYSQAMILGGVLGFFFLPAYALLLEVCSVHAGKERAGFATGILMLAGNIGGVVISGSMEAIKQETFDPAIKMLMGLLLFAVFLAFFVEEKPDDQQVATPGSSRERLNSVTL